MKIGKFTLAIALFALLIPLAMHSAKAESATTIRIDPTQTERLNIGDTFTINVLIEDAVNVYAVQVDIRYDCYVLKALSVTEGPFLPSQGGTLIAWAESRFIENAELDVRIGQIYYVATHQGDSPGASGNGVLFTVTFEVCLEESSVLDVITYKAESGSPEGTYFMDRNLGEIIPTLYDGYYGPPEPISNSPDYPEVESQGLDITSMILPLMILPAAVVFFFARKRAAKQN